MDASRLRPLRVGEVLDLAIKIYRDRFAEMARAVAVVTAPVTLMSAFVQVSSSPPTSTSTSFESQVDGGDFAVWLGGTLVVAAIGWIAGQLAIAACFDIVSGTYLDREPSWRESLRYAAERLRSLLWLQVVYGVLLVLLFVCCVIPGVYFYAAWAVAVPALLFEDRRGLRALRRSRELLEGRWWPTAGVLVLSFILAGIVSTIIRSVIVGLVTSQSGEVVDVIAGTIGGVGAGILTTPFTAAVTTVLYYDALVRKEGFDLTRMAESFGVEAPERWDDDRQSGLPVDLTGEQPPFWPPPPGWKPGG